ncbi:MAG TPA: MerR family transcriptional regulator [Acidimicrobiales bacterium]|nr:MerR family transcriptional regulator [Acidimicrobiales bacterium]
MDLNASPTSGDPRDGQPADALLPIDEVARCFGVRASAIRYYEERGLLEPVLRRGGRRWYGQAELRRLAVIRYWQQAGLMRLDDIAAVLSGPAGDDAWRDVLARQVRRLEEQIEWMAGARDFLEHVATHHDSPPDGCPHYEALIWGRPPPQPGEDHGAAVSGAERPPRQAG